jgi:ubiquinone biosynthesis protein
LVVAAQRRSNPQGLQRYKALADLLLKYGRSSLVKRGALDEMVEDSGAQVRGVPGDPAPEELAADLEKLGPTFVKLGQLLSTRPDLLPMPYVEALTRLQDGIEPFRFTDVQEIVTSELHVRLSKAFSWFDQTPLAAASIGQVHRARLRDGREVVVKVQRPNIRDQMVEDLEMLGRATKFVDKHTEVGRHWEFSLVVEEFRRMLLRELDYRQEAQHLETLADNLAGFDRIVVPRPIDDFSTARVLTIEYVRGMKITKISPVARTEFDGKELAEQLFRAYLQQILVDGFVHADPHPGNVFLTDDNRIALLDLGMVARVAPTMQERLLQFVIAVAEGRGDEAATIAIKVGEARPEFDEARFRRRVTDIVGQNASSRLEDIQVGKVVMLVTRVAAECSIRVPAELSLLAKTLLNLDQVGRVLDPHFDPNAAIRRYAAQLTQQRVRKSLSPGNLLDTVIETRELLQRLPSRVNAILEHVAANDLQLKVDAIDEKLLIEGFQKIANRITLGLVLASMIVAAALLMRVETSFRIFGYPGLAMVCFLSAVGGGIALAVNIVFHDERRTKAEAEKRLTRMNN